VPYVKINSYLTENILFITKINRLLQFREIIADYCENHKEHIITVLVHYLGKIRFLVFKAVIKMIKVTRRSMSVSIVTDCRMNDRERSTRVYRIRLGGGILPGDKCDGVKLIVHLRPEPRLRKSGDYSPRQQYAFM
jgi:hypothetical protein